MLNVGQFFGSVFFCCQDGSSKRLGIKEVNITKRYLQPNPNRSSKLTLKPNPDLTLTYP